MNFLTLAKMTLHKIFQIAGVMLLLTGCNPQPVTTPPPTVQPTTGMNATNLPLTVPAGFKLEEWLTGVSGARVLIGPDQSGNFWLSRTSAGIVAKIELATDGSVAKITDVFTGLRQPHGLLIDPTDAGRLLIAETDKVSAVRIDTPDELHTLVEFSGGDRHFTRTLLAGSDGKIYISIGSSCDVCVEVDERRASVWRMNPDGSGFEKFASGLRNSVFLAVDPVLGGIWATEMGRDDLGDDIPPDEINILQSGKNYGWPYCYGARVRDTTFGDVPANYCAQTEPAKVEIQAHSAPLGLAFVPMEGWPENYQNDLLITYHGSWNRSIPTGYKIVHFELNAARNVISSENFITGWLQSDEQVSGRPVGILLQPGGIGYITDDKRGVIYRLTVNSQS